MKPTLLLPLIILALNISYATLITEEVAIGPGGLLNYSTGTPVTTVGDHTYLTWLDGQSLKVGLLNDSGLLTEHAIGYQVQNNMYHVMPSIAVDKYGYIHVTADTHNQDWVYYISDQPLSVTGGFTQYSPGQARCPPGKRITYPHFYTDKNRELFLSFRCYVSDKYPSPKGPQPGNPAGGLAHYNADTKTWRMIGGIHAVNYPSGAGDEDPTLFWNDSGAYNGWYQLPGLKIFFDASNRMHVMATLADTASNSTWNGMTHLLYAYSDDLGLTFHKVNGSPIQELPLTIHNATVVAERTQDADIWGHLSNLGAFSPTAPVISYHIDGVGHVVKWNGTLWEEITVPAVKEGIFTNRNGEGIIFRPSFGLYRTKDKGQSFEHIWHGMYPYPAGAAKVDYNYYIETGNFRWQAIKKVTYDALLYTMYFQEE